MNNKRVIVIGAGAGGLMAGGRAGSCETEVLLLEKMAQPGKKILISGKSRCNLTNTKDLEDFIQAYGINGRFLYPAYHSFFRDDLIDFLKKLGVPTKSERGGRVFPESDNAGDVVSAFIRYLNENRVKLQTGVNVKAISTSGNRVTGVKTDQAEYPCDAVILATGGSSWPATGSTGDGYRMAAALGHTIVKLRPALVPLIVEDIDLAKSMQGVSLKNIRLTAYMGKAETIGEPRSGKNVIDTRMGEMMITHFGIGGPISLLMSLDVVDALEKGPVSVAIALKPGLSVEQLQSRLQKDFNFYSKKSFQNILKELLPVKMIDPIVSLSGIDASKRGNQINAKERASLVALLKSLRFNIKGPLPLGSAMVTAGGVSLKEIDPRTMASRIIKGLYFCGEVMDINADTGGYNLQAAFSTGYLAGESASAYVKNPE